MADRIRTGIFGGAFNPVHNGHLALAESCMSGAGLDRIIFIPTANPPHKKDEQFVSKQDRFNMLSLAVGDAAGYEISDIEFRRKGKSYTYDTLCVLKNMYPDDDFFLIIGADQFLSFECWYRYRDILSLACICTAARENEEEKEKIISYASSLDGLDRASFYLSGADVVKVSSHEIRDRISSGADVTDLLPRQVYNYIAERGLYGV